MIPAPGRVLLRPIDTEESVGRITLLESTRENMTPNQYEVVQCGQPAPCEDEDCTRPHDVVFWAATNHHTVPCGPGDWVLVRHRAVAPTEDDHLVVAWQDDILAILSVPQPVPQSPTGSSAR